VKKQPLRFAAAVLGVAVLLSACGMLSNLRAPNDQAITSNIQSELFQDPVLKARDIRVTTQKGVVVLNGVVNSDQEKSQVDRLVNGVPGVTQVIDQLSVAAPAAAQAAPPHPPAETPEPARATTRAERREPPARRPPHRAAAAAAPAAPAETASAAPAAAAAPTQAPEGAAAPAEAAAPAPAPEEPPPPEEITLPAGTVITVRMIEAIDSSRNQPGQDFSASINSPVVIGSRVIIPQGSDARVRLVQSASAGHMTGRSDLQVELVSLSVNGTSYQVKSSLYQKAGRSRGTRTAETVGGAAALGALIGAVIGHGKGAAIGAGVGAAAGTGVQATTQGQQVRIPSETKIDFTLKAPLTLTL
jgi:BON domain